MSIRKIIIGGIIGAVVALVLGYLFYGNLLADFYMENAGSASGVMKNDSELSWGPIIIGHLAWGMLFAVIFGSWANISTLRDGMKSGALLGLLIGLTYDMVTIGTTNIMTLTGAIVDVGITVVISAIVGGVVGWYFGRASS